MCVCISDMSNEFENVPVEDRIMYSLEKRTKLIEEVSRQMKIKKTSDVSSMPTPSKIRPKLKKITRLVPTRCV